MAEPDRGVHLLAFGAHPDDVELGCGGVLAAFVAGGGKAAIVDLTAGESATLGAPAQRWQEALQAASCLGAQRYTLRLPDTKLDANSYQQRSQVVRILRELKPSFLFLPHPGDPHPDHREASFLVQAAAFLAGVGGYGKKLGIAQRPGLLLAYPGPRQALEPHLVVDVSHHYEEKRKALACYASQFTSGGEVRTQLASGFFLAAMEGRDRAFGNLVGCQFGEGLFFLGPVNGATLQAFLSKLPCA